MKSSFITFALKIFMSGLTSDGTDDATCAGVATGGGAVCRGGGRFEILGVLLCNATGEFVPSIADSFGSRDDDLEVLLGVLGCKYIQSLN